MRIAIILDEKETATRNARLAASKPEPLEPDPESRLAAGWLASIVNGKGRSYRKVCPGDALYERHSALVAAAGLFKCDADDHNGEDGCPNPACWKYQDTAELAVDLYDTPEAMEPVRYLYTLVGKAL